MTPSSDQGDKLYFCEECENFFDRASWAEHGNVHTAKAPAKPKRGSSTIVWMAAAVSAVVLLAFLSATLDRTRFKDEDLAATLASVAQVSEFRCVQAVATGTVTISGTLSAPSSQAAQQTNVMSDLVPRPILVVVPNLLGRQGNVLLSDFSCFLGLCTFSAGGVEIDAPSGSAQTPFVMSVKAPNGLDANACSVTVYDVGQNSMAAQYWLPKKYLAHMPQVAHAATLLEPAIGD